jgi:hypothetical protein
MATPIQVTFRGLARVDWLETEAIRRAERLARFYPSITACRVLIEQEHHRHLNGNRFHVRIDVSVPRGAVVVSHDTTRYPVLRDLGAAAASKEAEIDRDRTRAIVAVRGAFDTTRRRLQDFARRQRGAVKTHANRAG